MYEGYDIYLHETGQFWMKSHMEKLGQTKPMFIPANMEKEKDHFK